MPGGLEETWEINVTCLGEVGRKGNWVWGLGSQHEDGGPLCEVGSRVKVLGRQYNLTWSFGRSA